MNNKIPNVGTVYDANREILKITFTKNDIGQTIECTPDFLETISNRIQDGTS